MYSTVKVRVKNHSSAVKARVQRLEAVEDDDADAREDEPDQGQVEQPPGAGVGLEDDGVELQPPAAQRSAEARRGVVEGRGGGQDGNHGSGRERRTAV